MTTLAISPSASARRWLPWAVGGATSLLALTGFWLLSRPTSADAAAAAGLGRFVMVTPSDMDIKVKKDGELQAVNNIDIINLVEGQSTIVQIVKEGANVKKGDTLVVLDSSDIRQKLEDQQLVVQKAESDLKTAQEMQRIQESQSAADVEAAEVTLELAKLALRQYSEGTYPEALAVAQTKLRMQEIMVKNKQEELEQTRNLFARGFVTAAKVKADELSVTTVLNDFRAAETALRVLTEFTYASELATRKSALTQAEQALSRIRVTGASTLAQRIVATNAAQAALNTANRKAEYLKEQLAHATITAPADGLVVYAATDRYGNAMNGIGEGTAVRERQQLLRLPDTSEMKVVLRANESQISKLAVGQQAMVSIVGVPIPVSATLSKKSPVADSSNRYWNPDAKEYPIELTLDRTPPGVLPNMSAQAEIFVERLHNVLAVPLSSIYTERATSYVFARAGDRIEPRAVKIEQSNETHARVADGLKGGEEVLILAAGQGRELLEKSGIRPPVLQQEGVEPVDASDELPPRKEAKGNKAEKNDKPEKPEAPGAVSATKPPVSASLPATAAAPAPAAEKVAKAENQKRQRDREPKLTASTTTP